MKSLKGHLLIASPGLSDPNFARSVVFLAEHSSEGAFGVVLSNPTSTKVADLWKAISNENVALEARAYRGGPVQPEAVVLLHAHEDLARESHPVVPGVYLAGEIEVLGEVIRRETALDAADASRVRVFCGYAGWGKGQLDAELKAGGWLVKPGSADIVFHPAPETLWSVLLDSLGGLYRFFALMPRNPDEN